MVCEFPSSVTVAGAIGRSTVARMLQAIAVRARPSATPDVVVVLSHGSSRQDESGPSLSWTELLSGLGADGVAVVSSDDARFASLARATGARVITFGLGGDAEVRAEVISAGSDGVTFTLVAEGESRLVSLPILGEHHVVNALAAVAAATASGIALDDAIDALRQAGSAGPSTMQLLRRRDGLLIIDDTVSSSVASASAALKALAVIGTEGRRTVAVLGPLDEAVDVGASALSEAAERSREAHDRVGRLVVRLNVRKLVVVGDSARHIHNAAGLEGSWDGESILVDTPEQAYDLLQGELGSGDVVLVKSSQFTALGSLAARLAEAPVPGGTA